MKYRFILDVWKWAWCCNWSINNKSKYPCMNTLRHNACTKHTVYVPSSISEISNMFWNIYSAFFPHPINWANVSGAMYLHSGCSYVLPNHLHEETQRHPLHKPPALWIYSHRQQHLWLVYHYLLVPCLSSHADLQGTNTGSSGLFNMSAREIEPAWKKEEGTNRTERKVGQA